MPRKTTVSDENVGQAVDSLISEGLDPTLERVRAKLGGGSYTTINRVLTTVLTQRQAHATQISEVPADLVEIGQRAVAAIYAAVQRQAASKIELIETNSRRLIDAANHARAEAAVEIERLEREAEQAAEALASSQRATQDALTRAERAEATSQAAQAEIQRLERAIVDAQAETKHLRQERDQFQARIAKAEAGVEAAQVELQKTAKALERAQDSERRARDETAELRGQIKAGDGKSKK
jgi:chromosome segregation ATPase